MSQYQPEYYNDDVSWGSHLSALLACVAATDGPVLEIGIGHYSTPILHAAVAANGRQLVSVEQDWNFRQFEYLRGEHHDLRFGAYDSVLPELAKREWSVVFIDHSPGERRGADLKRFIGRTTYAVVHDFSAACVADPIKPLIRTFPFHEIDERYPPSTLVLGALTIPSFK